MLGGFSDEASMPKKKSKKRFSAAVAVKSAARNVIGSPPATRRVVPKTKKTKPKYKPTLSKMLSRDE
jgi:hypothetical protein